MTAPRRAASALGQRPALVLAAAALLAAGLAAWAAGSTWQPSFDGAHHLALARDLAAFGRPPSATFPPGFCGLVAGPLRLLGSDGPDTPLRAAQAVNVVAAVVQGLLAYAFARRRLPPWPAVAVAALTLLLPSQLARAAGDTPEPPFGCLLLAGALLHERRRTFACGLVWGAAYLFRPDALVVVLGTAAVAAARSRRPPWRLLAGCAMVVVPSALYVHAHAGRWLLSGGAIALEHAATGPLAASTAGRAFDNLGEVAHGLAASVGIPIAASALLCATLAGGSWLALGLPLLALALFPIRVDARVVAPYLPLVLTSAWLAVPLAQEAAAAARRRSTPLLVATVLLLGAGAAGWPQVRGLAAGPDEFPGLRAAGLWLRTRATHQDVVVSATPDPSYWAWCRFARAPSGVAASRVIAWAQATGADWLVLDAHTTLTRVPELLPVLEEPPEHLRDQLVLVQTFTIEGRSDQTTYLYRIVQPDASLAGPQEAPRP